MLSNPKPRQGKLTAHWLKGGVWEKLNLSRKHPLQQQHGGDRPTKNELSGSRSGHSMGLCGPPTFRPSIATIKCTHWTLALCPHLLLLLDTIKHNYREKQVVCGAKNCGVLNLRAFKPQTPSGKTDCPPGMAA